MNYEYKSVADLQVGDVVVGWVEAPGMQEAAPDATYTMLRVDPEEFRDYGSLVFRRDNTLGTCEVTLAKSNETQVMFKVRASYANPVTADKLREYLEKFVAR